MSVQAITWAFQAPVSDPIKKFVLVTLANYADEYGVCWPSQSTLVAACACSERKLQYSLKALESEGWIQRIPRRRQNGSRRSDAVLLIGFNERKMPRSADEHPILSLLDVVPNEEGDTTNPHVVRGPNRHHVPHPPAPRAPLEPSLEPSNTTTGASPTRDPWLDACLQALNPEAVDLGTLEKTHELIGIWRREGYDLEAQVLPVLKARTETPRAGSQRIKSWAYFREPLRTAHAQRQRQAERAKIAENSNALSSKVPFDYEKHLAWLAEWVNSGRGVPPSLINNTQRDALLAAGLVTRERLKKLQIY